MRTTGFVRKLDILGRITIPSELRTKLDLGPKDAVEVFEDSDFMLLRKYAPCDVFTGESDDLIEFEGKKVSKNSIRKMAQQAGFVVMEDGD